MKSTRTNKKKHTSSARMDASRAAGLAEGIRKAERAQYEHLKRLQAEGLLEDRPSTVDLKTSVGAVDAEAPSENPPSSAIISLQGQQGLLKTLTHISTALWSTSNPGYVMPTSDICSAMKSDFREWAQAERELLKEQQRLDEDHRRRKNDISEYVEAAVSFQHMKRQAEAKLLGATA